LTEKMRERAQAIATDVMRGYLTEFQYLVGVAPRMAGKTTIVSLLNRMVIDELQNYPQRFRPPASEASSRYVSLPTPWSDWDAKWGPIKLDSTQDYWTAHTYPAPAEEEALTIAEQAFLGSSQRRPQFRSTTITAGTSARKPSQSKAREPRLNRLALAVQLAWNTRKASS
jgi:hypothetical protein